MTSKELLKFYQDEPIQNIYSAVIYMLGVHIDGFEPYNFNDEAKEFAEQCGCIKSGQPSPYGKKSYSKAKTQLSLTV